MRALRWILGTGVVLAVIAGLIITAGVVWLNTYLRSSDFRQEIEARAGQSLGGTVRIDQVDFDPWHGVKLKGFFYQIEPGHVSGPGTIQATIAQINCTYSWRELLDRRLLLTGIILDQPQIILTRQPTAVPLAPPVAEPPPDVNAPDKPTDKLGHGRSVPFQFILERARIKEGTVSLRDTSGANLVEMTGVDASSKMTGGNATGTLRVARLASSFGAEVTHFSAPFTWQNNALDASPLEADAFGGKIAGGYTFGASGSSLDLNAKGVDVAQVTAATASGSSAKLSGALDLQSKWRNPESGSVDGEGDAQLVNGRLEGVRLLQEVSHLIRVKELEAPVIKKAQTHFIVQNNQIRLIGLQLDSGIFLITGDGVIGFDGSLQANLVLILSRESMRRIPRQIAASFVQKPDGTGSVAFQVTGTTSNPQTDLPARMLIQNTQIQNAINRALNRFFH